MTPEGSRRLLTFRLDTERRQRLRARLAREGRTMSEVVTSGLRQYVQHARHRDERGDGPGALVLPERIAARLRELRSSGRSEMLSTTLAALHEAGWPLRPLAEALGISKQAVQARLRRRAGARAGTQAAQVTQAPQAPQDPQAAQTARAPQAAQTARAPQAAGAAQVARAARFGELEEIGRPAGGELAVAGDLVVADEAAVVGELAVAGEAAVAGDLVVACEPPPPFPQRRVASAAGLRPHLTVKIDYTLRASAHRVAADEGHSLTQVIESILDRYLRHGLIDSDADAGTGAGARAAQAPREASRAASRSR
jgi:antitoxin component of RelBE/YafQ-DinJ toxin-antitoxin module